MSESYRTDLRLIEAGFPCHQVGAETQRERETGKAPPTHRLHVWWARRPLTPSRAAILASLLPADTDPAWFLQQLGIKKDLAEIGGTQWIVTKELKGKIRNDHGNQLLEADEKVIKALEKENEIRSEIRSFLENCKINQITISYSHVIEKWLEEVKPIAIPYLGSMLSVSTNAADPAFASEKMALGKAAGYRFPGDPYGYGRAFENAITDGTNTRYVILDPTAGGGSIPFEALRLGYDVIANELNPVATIILHATIDYPAKYGSALLDDIKEWGNSLLEHADSILAQYYSDTQLLSDAEMNKLKTHLKRCPDVISQFDKEQIVDYLYCRQVVCPNCASEAPLLNTCWLSKESGDKWGVRIVTDNKPRNGKVKFETYRLAGSKGPNGEDPESSTVNRGIGQCVHCKQAIDAEEIKRQARGESNVGKWQDRLYCVAAVRFQPKLDKNGKPQRYATGERAGQIRSEKVRFFRSPNDRDLAALREAEKRLKENWDRWDAAGLIPTENVPLAHKTKEPIRVGMTRWCDMFTPRQLLGHITLVEELNRLKPQILEQLGAEKGRAVMTYLQFAIDKVLDYNSRQTLWHASRGVIAHTFTRHDYSLKWTFGELILTGDNSGTSWGLSQIIDAYQAIETLLNGSNDIAAKCPNILNGTAAYMPTISDASVDLICIDPPYYNNVQYAELSDYFYVWQKRTLSDIYPNYFTRRLTNKKDEAVANPDRDGSTANAKMTYEKMMGEIFSECRRVVNSGGLMTVMFTHKSQDAWEALTKSLIENGWMITASAPVESESTVDIHHKEMAAAVSSVFLTCRKRARAVLETSTWTGFGGSGVQQKIRAAVEEGLVEFKPLKLNPVDEMVASYGRALRVLSEQWPVLDGDEPVSPIRAMNEASRVVAENQIQKITSGRLRVEDLAPETAMAVTLFGIYGLSEFPYDEALNLSRSLNMSLEARNAGYATEGRFIGINTEARAGRRTRTAAAEDTGFHAPLLRKGSKLRLAKPEERNENRLESPQTEWDILHGLIMAYRKGDVPVARAYLNRHAEGRAETIKDLLKVWATEMADDTLRKEAQAAVFGLK